MREALFRAERSGAADLVGGGKALFWPEEGKAKALVEPRSVLDCTRSPSPNNSTSTLSSSLGGGAADSTGVAAVSDSSAAAAAAEATKWGAPGEHGGGGKEDWAGGCELPPIPAGLDMGLVGGGDSWDAVLGNAAAAGQDQTFLNWIIGAAGDLDQPGPPLPVHQHPLLDNAGFGFPAAEPLGFSLDPHLGGVASDMSSPGAVSHTTNSGGGSKASSVFGLFSTESASLQPPPPPVLFHEGIDTKPPLLGAQPPGLLLHQYQHQHQPPPPTTFFMPLPSFADHNQQSPLLQPPPKRHQSTGDDLYLRNRAAAAQGLPFPPLHGPAPFQLQPSPPPPHGAMKTTAAEAAQQQLLDELVAAAKAAEAGNSIGAREILARLNHQLPPLGKPFLRSASYLKEALLLALAEGHHGACRLTSPLDVALKLAAYKSFSDLSPVLQFTNFTATQALLDEIASSTASCIHVIDFDLGVGGQWASFLQELAHRRSSGGAALPFVKLTAFVSAASHHQLELRLTRDNIAQFAADLGIPFEFNAVNSDMINPAELISTTGDEVVAVVLPVGCSARAPPLPVILRSVKQLGPKIIIAIDHGGDRADLPFSQHFLNCFQSCVFLLDSLDAAGIDPDSASKIEKFLIQPRIEDTVLGWGKADKPMAWRSAFAAAGFAPVPPSNLAEAQADCLLKRVQVRGFHVEKCGVGLTLYWQRGELVTVSAWRC
ncbi:Scarecrow-like protein 6 [Dichanthelium oligosanthes]|uniref:Scarecrow-like protein 6 n=1 Tax=Dichanthelium oligosanthes TaxID=888268 RepID=A0A1E5UXY9_9POAL|nr:Scarecrow-like protein 6 [Dichanthelium oligosanthes]